MSPSPATIKPVVKPEVTFRVAPEALEERCTIVHCRVSEESFIRVWPTTFLVQPDGNRKSLLQAYGIAEYPNWYYVPAGHVFTLVFEGLDKSCTRFDLLEDIPEPGGFHIRDIPRNKQDVYTVEVI